CRHEHPGRRPGRPERGDGQPDDPAASGDAVLHVLRAPAGTRPGRHVATDGDRRLRRLADLRGRRPRRLPGCRPRVGAYAEPPISVAAAAARHVRAPSETWLSNYLKTGAAGILAATMPATRSHRCPANDAR